MIEEWKSVKGFEGLYEISSLGRLKGLKRRGNHREKILTLPITRTGYNRPKLYNKELAKGYKFLYVHRIVAETFIANPDRKREVNHINGIKIDNKVENLEWTTPSENVRHAFKVGLKSLTGEKNVRSKLKEAQVKRIRLMKEVDPTITAREIASMFDVKKPCVDSILGGYNWKHIL